MYFPSAHSIGMVVLAMCIRACWVFHTPFLSIAPLDWGIPRGTRPVEQWAPKDVSVRPGGHWAEKLDRVYLHRGLNATLVDTVSALHDPVLSSAVKMISM